jgi:hypothetical protein
MKLLAYRPRAVIATLLILGVTLLPADRPNTRAAGRAHDTAAAVNWNVNYLKLFGQTDPGQTTRNAASPFGIYHSSGVVVDRSSTPNKIYVVDSGNNRILGYDGMPNGDGTDAPAVVFGQPDFAHSACNHDANVGMMGAASADSLCLLGYPNYVNNTAESWQRFDISVDSSGDLFVGDQYNNRVLEYFQPFSNHLHDSGGIKADRVWGQPDFTSNGPNGGGQFDQPAAPTDSTLNLSQVEYEPILTSSGGTSVDPDGQHIWVADTYNHRVLRYPLNSPHADLVIGQASFTTRGVTCTVSNPQADCMGSLAYPILAAVNPNDRKLYVLEQWSSGYTDPFATRILVYNSPFAAGMAASQVIIPNQPLVASNNPSRPAMVAFRNWTGFDAYPSAYLFQSSGFAFNPMYSSSPAVQASNPLAKGVLWVNEHQANRTILIDGAGNIITAIGVRDLNTRGGDAAANYPNCGINPNSPFYLWWPGGSIGFDSQSNIYLSDEQFSRVARYALPYTVNPSTGCPPAANGGFFPGTVGSNFNVSAGDQQAGNVLAPVLTNVDTARTLGEAIGMTVYDGQLIVIDEDHTIKVWNNYSGAGTYGLDPDYIIGPYQGSGTNGTVMLSNAIDAQGRLWLFDDQRQLRMYQLPFTQNNQAPLATGISMYWINNGVRTAVRFPVSPMKPLAAQRGLGPWAAHALLNPEDQEPIQASDLLSVTFDNPHHEMYLDDEDNSRILRVSSYDDVSAGLQVDTVLGQPSMATPTCAGYWTNPNTPNAVTLCRPRQAAFDHQGNMYVVDNDYECHGNIRIDVYTAQTLAGATGMFPNLAIDKVLIAPNATSSGPCRAYDQPGSPISVAFTNTDQMVVANDGYYGYSGMGWGDLADNELRPFRQLWFYENPLQETLPDGYIDLPLGSPGEIAVDPSGNLLIQDHTWYRVWGINPSIDPSWLSCAGNSGCVWGNYSAVATPTGTPATATPSPTATSTPVPAGACPIGWSCTDVAGDDYTAAGSQTDNGGGSWTVRSSVGGDIFGNSDVFHFIYQQLTGDGYISAHIASSTGSGYDKIGIMFRNDLSPGSVMYSDVAVANQVNYRGSAGGSAATASNSGGAIPYWIKIGRAGNVFTAYTSANGSTWSAVAGSAVTLADAGSGMDVGVVSRGWNASTISVVNTVLTGSSAATATATATASAPGSLVTMPVAAGWNLISLPLSPTDALDAQMVLTVLLAQTGGSYAEIDAYSSGQWSPSLYDDAGGIGGDNFTLQLGHGYALYSDKAGSITITGTAVGAQTVGLSPGWNLVGFPDAASNPSTAGTVLTGLLGQTNGSYAEIDGYAGGQWNPNAYDDHGNQGGTNFTVQTGQGYALYTDKAATLPL